MVSVLCLIMWYDRYDNVVSKCIIVSLVSIISVVGMIMWYVR